jgi:hypothetical protein
MAGCKQVFCGKFEAGNATTQYGSPTSFGTLTTSAGLDQPWLVTGDFRNLVVSVATAPGAGKSWTYTLHKNGASTLLTVTIADAATSGSDTSNTITVTAGDTVTLVRTSSGLPTGSISDISLEFNGETAGESGYGGGLPHSLNTTSAAYNTPFGASTWTTAGATIRHNLVPTAGNLTALRADVNVAPGAGKSWTFAYVLNDVVQDGAGATTDTRATISDAATSGSWTGTLAVSAGDRVRVECTPAGTPAAARAGLAVKFVATADGESIVSGGVVDALPQTGTEYNLPPLADTWNATETDRDVVCGVSLFDLTKLYIRVTAAPGSGDTWTFNTRKNTANSGPSVVISGAQTTGNDTSSTATMTNGDRWSLACVYSGGGSAAAGSNAAWAWVQDADSDYVAPGGGGGSDFPSLSVAI